MAATIDAAGITIQPYDEILAEIVEALATALTLTEAQAYRVATDVRSSLGQIARIEAEREGVMQQTLLDVYNTLSFSAEGAALDRTVRLLGVTRSPAISSRVEGLATGTNGTEIANGVRIRWNRTGSVWVVVDGPYTIGAGGTSIFVEGEVASDAVVVLSPAASSDDWTVLDTVIGWSDVAAPDAFDATAQPVIGAARESDAALRGRAGIEAFRRAQGPLLAIDANVAAVPGVTYVRTYENRTLAIDANGLPGKSINTVVDGGDNTEIAEAIFAARPAGAEVHGTDVTVVLTDAYGFAQTMRFDRVAAVPIWIRATLTTSTSEEATTPGIVDSVAALLLEQAPIVFGIGSDVLPWRMAAAIGAAGYEGVDNVVVELSLDGVTYSTARRVITTRQRSTYAAARITVLEN